MGEGVETRLLVPGDEARLFAFLEGHLDTSLFILSNVERAGLLDRGERLQGSYCASFDANDAMTAVAGHAWSGNLMLQGDRGLEDAVRAAVAASGRVVRGLIGPWSLVKRARKALAMEHTPTTHDGPEVLFALSLDELSLPALLRQPNVEVRPPTEAEVSGLVGRFRADYQVETLGAERTAKLLQASIDQVRAWVASGSVWVLTIDDIIVAMSAFNAETRGIVQIGGVFTPPELRGRGYARTVLAGTLRLARERGATRSVLFTSETNPSAQRCYTALGYRVVGDYGLVLFLSGKPA